MEVLKRETKKSSMYLLWDLLDKLTSIADVS